jgi:hypothetical protein
LSPRRRRNHHKVTERCRQLARQGPCRAAASTSHAKRREVSSASCSSRTAPAELRRVLTARSWTPLRPHRLRASADNGRTMTACRKSTSSAGDDWRSLLQRVGAAKNIGCGGLSEGSGSVMSICPQGSRLSESSDDGHAESKTVMAVGIDPRSAWTTPVLPLVNHVSITSESLAWVEQNVGCERRLWILEHNLAREVLPARPDPVEPGLNRM